MTKVMPIPETSDAAIGVQRFIAVMNTKTPRNTGVVRSTLDELGLPVEWAGLVVVEGESRIEVLPLAASGSDADDAEGDAGEDHGESRMDGEQAESDRDVSSEAQASADNGGNVT